MNIMFFLTPKKDVFYLYEDYTLREVLEKMENNRYFAVPLINRDGQYLGTVTEGDILWFIKNYHSNPENAEHTPIGSVIRYVDYSPAQADTEIGDLFEIMLEQSFVPVIDDRGVFIGIITRKNIISFCYNRYFSSSNNKSLPSSQEVRNLKTALVALYNPV